MPHELTLFTESDLVDRLVHRHLEGKPTVFLVGAPLSAPRADGEPGVPGVAAMIGRAVDAIKGVKGGVGGGATAPPSYQEAFARRTGVGGQPEVNELVRHSVLEALAEGNHPLREKAARGEPKACRELEQELEAWALTPGTESLGQLLTAFPQTFGQTLLTTNFDPLLEIAVRRAGGHCWHTALHRDGSIEQSEGEGCQVVHAHGFWRGRADTLHSAAQLQQERPQLAADLRRLFQRCALVVVAYGGWEDVFTRTLVKVVADAGASPEVLWTFYGSDEAAVRASAEPLLAGLAPGIDGGRVTLFAGIDAHRFFPALLAELQRRTPVTTYLTWAQSQHQGMPLAGLGGGDVLLPFDKVYVPLAITRRAEHDLEARASASRGELARELAEEELELEEIFAAGTATARHAAVFGQPGAGKSTALRKLFRLCLEGGDRLRGLVDGTLPLFVRLRRFTEDDLAADLPAFLGRQLAEASDGTLPAALGPALWKRGRLLLLLDGLDEIAATDLRAEFCGWLERQLEDAATRQIRAVVSCRYSGYGGSDIKLGDSFLHLDVKPLSGEQGDHLVDQWFRQAPRAVPNYTASQARKAAANLKKALRGKAFSGQRGKVLVGSPLLLTLLCLLVLRGGRMPRNRVAFYDEALRVLLTRWRLDEGDEEPLLTLEEALAVLRPLAWKLHRRRGRKDLSRLEIVREIAHHTHGRQPPLDPFRALDWLHREAGVLEEWAPDYFGFLHLGLQEYLAASYVALEGEEVVDDLVEELAEAEGAAWWEHVLLLFAGLPGNDALAPLLRRLLARDELLLGRAALLRELIEDAAELPPAPFIEVLSPAAPPRRLAAVLRLLHGRWDPRLEEAVRGLAGGTDLDVKALAEQYLAELALARARPAGDCGLLLVHHPEDLAVAMELARRLREGGLGVLEPVQPEALLARLEKLVKGAQGVVILVRPGAPPPWAEDAQRELLELLTLYELPVVAARLSGEKEVAPWPESDIPEPTWCELREGASPSELAEAVQRGMAGGVTRRHGLVTLPLVEDVEEVPPVTEPGESIGEPFVEEHTGIRFLWVPGGRFEMGTELQEVAMPVHWVQMSPFWLAETPVTNRQYQVFLETGDGANEPRYWRDQRFSAPEQPVVGVSWEEALAFCRWLSRLTGRRFQLPSEAQWELAARDTGGGPYPWGEESPDSSRACFGLDWEKGQPAPVGSFPAGRGPYGHLDLAGSVWEWCLDVWDEEAYRKRAGSEPRNPVVEEGDEGVRVLRGGGWYVSAEYLRSAFRLGDPATNRDRFIGFRVAVVPASLDS